MIRRSGWRQDGGRANDGEMKTRLDGIGKLVCADGTSLNVLGLDWIRGE